jgi:hypothetical protein
MALENLNWGYTKIRDALRTGLKIEIGRTTVADILARFADALTDACARLGVIVGRGAPYKVDTNDDLIELCKAMAAMAAYEITATDSTVELNQSPENVIAAIELATKNHVSK